MGHPIRYARTNDGVNIAFCALGEGEPLIYLPVLPWCNFSIGFGSPFSACHPEELSTFCRLIVYDARGCGLSDHDAADLTLDGFARDIDAVADAAGCERFVLYGSADASRVMIRYAATRPERVSRLILWLPSVSPERLRGDPVLRAVRPLVERDWDTYLRTIAHAVVGGWDAERAPYAEAFADTMRGGIRQEEYPRIVSAMREHDVSADLARVQAPTLVLTREHVALYHLPVVSEVAAGIADAKLVVSHGNWLMPCVDDDITREIAAFLGASFPADVSAQPREAPRHGFGSGVVEPNGNPGKLSRREKEVLALISAGKTNAEIAQELVVAPATASRHVHNILNKLGMSRRAEAAVYAAIEGLALARQPISRT